MKFLISFVFVSLLCGGISALPRQGELQCKPPNGGGITAVIKEFVDMLPLDKLLSIYLTAITSDEEVQEVMEYIESEKFQEIITAVTSTTEFGKLVKLACTDLYLDVIYYANILNDILGLPTIPRPMLITSRNTVYARPGFLGLLQDLVDVIDVDAMRKLFEEKSKTDEYVKKALQILRSDDFKNILRALHNTPAFNDMLNDLRKMGVDVDAIIEFIEKFLGMSKF